jgi:hypothetical protein
MPESPEFAPWLSSPQRILVISLNTADNGVAPALAVLRRGLPHAWLCLWLFRTHKELAAVDEILLTPPNWREANAIRQAVVAVREREFDVAIILTPRGISPYPAGYICYLAGVPVRIGQSLEFSGRVLSHWIKPAPDTNPDDDYIQLLYASGLLPAAVNGLSNPLTVSGETV